MATINERKVLRARLEKDGYVVQIDKWPARLTYYKPDGSGGWEALPNLPADPMSMKLYLDRGFILNPPKDESPPVATSGAGPTLVTMPVEEALELVGAGRRQKKE
mgnify:FL=1